MLLLGFALGVWGVADGPVSSSSTAWRAPTTVPASCSCFWNARATRPAHLEEKQMSNRARDRLLGGFHQVARGLAQVSRLSFTSDELQEKTRFDPRS